MVALDSDIARPSICHGITKPFKRWTKEWTGTEFVRGATWTIWHAADCETGQTCSQSLLGRVRGMFEASLKFH